MHAPGSRGEEYCRDLICEVGRRLYGRQLVAGFDGNISCRLDGERVLCTPSTICKGQLSPKLLCLVDMNGRQIAGERARTSEIELHLELYRACSAVGAVVHCHAPHASAFAISEERLTQGVLAEAEIFLGPVATVPYRTPGTREFAAELGPLAETCNAAILANHGCVAWGPDLERAWANTEMLDASCRIILLGRQLGSVRALTPAQCQELRALRVKFSVPIQEAGQS